MLQRLNVGACSENRCLEMKQYEHYGKNVNSISLNLLFGTTEKDHWIEKWKQYGKSRKELIYTIE